MSDITNNAASGPKVNEFNIPPEVLAMFEQELAKFPPDSALMKSLNHITALGPTLTEKKRTLPEAAVLLVDTLLRMANSPEFIKAKADGNDRAIGALFLKYADNWEYAATYNNTQDWTTRKTHTTREQRNVVAAVLAGAALFGAYRTGESAWKFHGQADTHRAEIVARQAEFDRLSSFDKNMVMGTIENEDDTAMAKGALAFVSLCGSAVVLLLSILDGMSVKENIGRQVNKSLTELDQGLKEYTDKRKQYLAENDPAFSLSK